MLRLLVYPCNSKGISPKPIPIDALSSTTISTLKTELYDEFEIAIDKQIWIIRNVICLNNETIENCIGKHWKSKENVAFLCISLQSFHSEQQFNENKTNIDKFIPTCVLNAISEHYNGAILSTNRRNLTKARDNVAASSSTTTTARKTTTAAGTTAPTNGWTCPICTYLNLPSRPGCQMCTESRPDNFIQPEENDLTETERLHLCQQRLAELEFHQSLAEENREAKINFNEAMEFDLETPFYANSDQFECPICLEPIEPGEGIILRRCTHEFCRTCITAELKGNRHVFARCPMAMSPNEICGERIEHCEIRALLTQNEYSNYLTSERERSMERFENIFHCRTPNCNYAVAYENRDVKFICEICNVENCIDCERQHHPLTCQQYKDEQRRLNLREVNQERDKIFNQDMIQRGVVRRCPNCNVLIEKRGGCNVMSCRQCRQVFNWTGV